MPASDASGATVRCCPSTLGDRAIDVGDGGVDSPFRDRPEASRVIGRHDRSRDPNQDGPDAESLAFGVEQHLVLVQVTHDPQLL